MRWLREGSLDVVSGDGFRYGSVLRSWRRSLTAWYESWLTRLLKVKERWLHLQAASLIKPPSLVFVVDGEKVSLMSDRCRHGWVHCTECSPRAREAAAQWTDAVAAMQRTRYPGTPAPTLAQILEQQRATLSDASRGNDLNSGRVIRFKRYAELNDSGNPKDIFGKKKPDLSLVPPAATLYAALAMQDGAGKYGPYNWREKKVLARVYVAAAMRHLSQYLDGEDLDPDGDIPHVGRALACLGILADAIESGNLIDDRPKPGPISRLYARFTKK